MWTVNTSLNKKVSEKSRFNLHNWPCIIVSKNIMITDIKRPEVFEIEAYQIALLILKKKKKEKPCK